MIFGRSAVKSTRDPHKILLETYPSACNMEGPRKNFRELPREIHIFLSHFMKCCKYFLIFPETGWKKVTELSLLSCRKILFFAKFKFFFGKCNLIAHTSFHLVKSKDFWSRTLQGQCHEILEGWFFHQMASSGPIRCPLWRFQIFVEYSLRFFNMKSTLQWMIHHRIDQLESN